jgi:tripartite-type tricarboxylate transporter receptor subunit TctC
MNRRAFLTGAAALGLGAAAFEPARGQSFPSNVIRIVVPYSASTPPDILARTVATALSEGEGWNVIVENKPGGVMTIGATEVLKHPADEAINKALKTDKLRETLAKLGTDPGGGTPEAFGTLVNGEIARWTKVIKDAGIKINT